MGGSKNSFFLYSSVKFFLPKRNLIFLYFRQSSDCNEKSYFLVFYGEKLSDSFNFLLLIYLFYRFSAVLLINCSYLKILYVRLINPKIPVALGSPIDQIYNPLMLCSMKPKTCSTRALVFDLILLFACCSVVNGWLRYPFSHT